MREDCGKGENDEDARKRDTNAIQHERGAKETINGVNTILDLIGITQVLKRNLSTKWSLSQLLLKATSWIKFIYNLSAFQHPIKHKRKTGSIHIAFFCVHCVVFLLAPSSVAFGA